MTGIRVDISKLTSRELEVGKLIALGLSNEQLSYRLDIKMRTSEHYVTIIKEKLQIEEGHIRVKIALAFL